MFSYRLTIQYQGTYYHGWQKQTKQDLLTIQEILEDRIYKAFHREGIYTVASGRTDAGVHALAQVVRIDLDIQIEESSLKKALNNLLPRDIKVRKVYRCENTFHPQKDAVSKEYRYFFYEKHTDASFIQNTFSFGLRYPIDISLMKKACELFIGEKDFFHFYCEGSDISSSIRTIKTCDIIKSSGFNGLIKEHYYLIIEGNGFLKQMVRLIMGAIWAVGMKKLSLDDIQRALESPNPKSCRHLAALAPAEGLMLYKVNYHRGFGN